MTTGPSEWPDSLRWQRRRLVAFLLVGLFLALGPVWGLLYTLGNVLVAAAEAGRSAAPHVAPDGSLLPQLGIKRVTLSLRPTLIGMAFAPFGIALCAWCILRLAALRKRAIDMENSRA